MPRLAVARDQHIDAVYRESHAVWGGGLKPTDYRGLWDDLCQTPWGSRYARFFVWLDDAGRVLSSMKVYRPQLRLHGRVSRATVVGAVFTPREHRRRGHAANMVREAVKQARERGEPAALLFSDIGTQYYRACGFQALPAEEQSGPLPRSQRPVPAGWSFRSAGQEDQEQIQQAHHDFCMSRDLAIIRDREHWRFLWLRTHRFFERLRDPDLVPSCRVALHQGRFAGYLIEVHGRGDWHVREVGARGGDLESMATILRMGARSARQSGMRGFYGWLPPELLEQMNDWPIRSRPRQRAVPMIVPLDGRADPSGFLRSGQAYLPFQDQF